MFLQEAGFRPNVHVFSALIGRASRRLDYIYLKILLKTMSSMGVWPNEVIIKQLEFASQYPPNYNQVSVCTVHQRVLPNSHESKASFELQTYLYRTTYPDFFRLSFLNHSKSFFFISFNLIFNFQFVYYFYSLISVFLCVLSLLCEALCFDNWSFRVSAGS